MKNLRKIESLLEKIKPLDPPSRFEKRSDGFYGFKHGEWSKYTLEELTALKDTIKARQEERRKRGEHTEIKVIIVDDEDPESKGPEPFYKWPDGWTLDEKGISNAITINIVKV